MSEELATTQAAGLPEQRYNPQSQEITADDIPTPRVKFAQGLSRVVLENDVPYGAIYTVIGQNDENPTVLRAPAKSKGELGDAVRFYVLAGPKKGFSWTNTAGDLDNNRDGSYPDLSVVKNNDPKEVYRTFDYVIAVADPELKLPLPHKLMLYRRWGADAAKRINMETLLAQMDGKDTSAIPFSLRAKKDQNDAGSFATAIVEPIENLPAAQAEKDAALVAKLRPFVGQATAPAPSSAPAIEAPALD